ncbi:MAG: hypothetical protein IPG66_08455 [Hydrogenophilales bacterium]|nr:hypothetical protein [Hydrogenophilales bacterium]
MEIESLGGVGEVGGRGMAAFSPFVRGRVSVGLSPRRDDVTIAKCPAEVNGHTTAPTASGTAVIWHPAVRSHGGPRARGTVAMQRQWPAWQIGQRWISIPGTRRANAATDSVAVISLAGESITGAAM